MSRIEKALEKAAAMRCKSSVIDRPQRERPVELTEPSLSRKTGQAKKLRHENPLLVMINDPLSPIAEEYRKLKSVVAQLTKMEGFHNSLLITSAIPHEGKSLTALNLAACLAQELDHTVLLVDADLRRPSLHAYLDLENGAGLAQCLTDGLDLAEAIQPTGVEKLSLLCAGSVVANPVELYSSQRMKELTEELKHRYHDRYIIFDSPPLLPFAESRVLSQLVDGVILVAKESYTPIASLQEAVGLLSGAEVFGVVYNEAEISRFSDRYGYYRDYSSARQTAAKPSA